PAVHRRQLHRAVVAALLGRPGAAVPAGPMDWDRATRLVSHAVAAGDTRTVITHAPTAARAASWAGAHGQALSCYEAVRPLLHHLPPAQQAATLDGYGVELRFAHRYAEAVQAGQEAADRYERLGGAQPRAECLSRLARHQLTAGR